MKCNDYGAKLLVTIMRFTFIQLFIAIICSCMLYANGSRAQLILKQKISLSRENTSVENILKKIGKKADIRFVYANNLFDNNKLISVDYKNERVEDILSSLFQTNGIVYRYIDQNFVVLKKLKGTDVATNTRLEVTDSTQPISLKDDGKAQLITITGTVSDSQGPLPGVTVIVADTKNGVSTGVDGKYSIQAPADGVLTFSFLGYTTQQIPVNSRTVIDVTMVSSKKSLDEVVVVGYGTQKKVNLTGAVASVSGAELESRPITNLGDGLNGLIPNLNVNVQNGQPGTGATFNIRGVTSIGVGSSSSPLVLVDGVQRDPNLIDPNDVESVSVLKDAASSAIYGGRAAYGVILITTKTAKKGKPVFSYSGSYTISRPTILPKYANSDDYIKLFNEAQRTGSATGGNTSSDPLTALDSVNAAAYRADPVHNPAAYIDPGNPLKYRYVGNTDWVKVLYPGWAPLQQHNVSLSGGDDNTSYTANMGFFRQDGLEKVANQVYNRYTPSLKLNSNVAKWLTLNLSMSLTHTDNNQGATTSVGQGGSWVPGDLRPLQPVYNPDGNFSGQGSYTNPVAVLTNSGRDIDKQNDFWTTGRVIIKPADHFNITSDFTYNSFTDFDRANLIPFNEYGVDGAFLDIFPWTNPSQITENRSNYNYNALNIYANYENTFNKKHYFKALVGYNQEYKHYQTDYAFAKNLIDPTLVSIGQNNDTKPVVNGIETEYALAGAFYRLNYIYDRRYLIEVNGRYDGTSRFQADHRFAFSPSVSAGWNIAEEAFMGNLKNTISELKLRASYGQLPNQQAGTTPGASYQYPYIATLPYAAVGYLFNNQLGQGVGAPGLVSPTFTWEKVQTKNIGLDYSIFKDRLSGSFDYYITDTKDMLVGSQQLPAVLGTTPPPLNSANLRTKGWELSVTWKDHVLDNKLGYKVSLGLSDYTSYITKYDKNPTLNIGDYYPGQRLNTIWGFVTDGFYKTNAEAAGVDNTALAGYTWLAGDVKYADLNHDGKIDYGNKTVANPGDEKIIGNSTPRYRFNFNLSLTYKSFDFTTFVQGVLKQDFNPVGTRVFDAFASSEYDIPFTYAADHWTPANPNAYFPRVRFAGAGNDQPQTGYLLNAAYARVKQLTLGYTLPNNMLSKIGVKRVRVYVTGANLITITSLFKAYDPELLNYQTYPVNKSLSFGLQATL